MVVGILKAAIEMIKNVSDLCKTALDAGDSEKFAHSINELNAGVNDTYEEMRKIIINNDKYTADEKLIKLKELADSEEKAKANCASAINGNRDNVTKVILDIFAGFLTCGISFAPAIVKGVKNSISNNEDAPVFDDTQIVYELNDHTSNPN